MFGYRKKEKLQKFEIRNIKQINDDIKSIKYFNPRFQIKNKEIISRIQLKNDYGEKINKI